MLLPGEGSFHQFHGGVTTSSREDRQAMIDDFNVKLNSHWQGQFRALSLEPVLLGQVCDRAMGFFLESTEKGLKRLKRLERGGVEPWPDQRVVSGRD